MSTTEHENKGIWQRLGTALGDLFGGHLPEERQLEVEVLFGLVGFLAKSDGIITSYESQFANKLMDEFKLPLDGRQAALAAFERGRQAGYDVEAEVGRFLVVHPTGSEIMERVFQSLLRLALSDDRIYARERQALERVTLAFGLTLQALEQRLGNLSRA